MANAEKVAAGQTAPLIDILDYFFGEGTSDKSRNYRIGELFLNDRTAAATKEGFSIFVQNNGETAIMIIVKLQTALELTRKHLEHGLTPEQKFNLGRLMTLTRDEIAQIVDNFMKRMEAEHGTTKG